MEIQDLCTAQPAVETQDMICYRPESNTFEKKEKIGDKKSAIKIGDKKSAINIKMKETIIEYLTDHAEDKASSIADYIGLKPSRTRDYLNELITEGVVVAEGGNRNRTYKLKA